MYIRYKYKLIYGYNRMKLEYAYTFDDVALVPQYNNVESRTIPDTSTWITNKTKIDIPIIASNMDTVIGDKLADILIEYGSIPIFHRYTTFDQQLLWGRKYGNRCYLSCGLNNIDQTIKLIRETNIRGICLDIAHAYSSTTFNFIKELRKQVGNNDEIIKDKDLIVGNVCTPFAYQEFASMGANGIKVGIGPGSCCSTRIVTGCGIPQMSAILECSEIAEKMRVPMIADGGIRIPADFCKAIAGGSSTVMVGGLFSNTFESNAPKEEIEGKIYSKYRGQASEDFQIDFYGTVKNNVPEGKGYNES